MKREPQNCFFFFFFLVKSPNISCALSIFCGKMWWPGRILKKKNGKKNSMKIRASNKHPLSENKICGVMWFYLYDWLKTINKPISHNIRPPMPLKSSSKSHMYTVCTQIEFETVFFSFILSFLSHFDLINLIPTKNQPVHSRYGNPLLHSKFLNLIK